MSALRQMTLWSQVRSASFALFLATVALCLVRARDQPGLDVGLGGTTVSIVPGDVALALLAIVSIAIVAGRRVARRALPLAVASAAFCALLLASAAANGTTAFVSGTKLVELAALALGAAVLVRTRDRLEALVDLLLLVTAVADVAGIVKFVTGGGGRQASFLGEHDFAALATLPLLYGLALLHQRGHTRRAWLAIGVGSLGCVLGAALASLLGLYLGAATLVVVQALARRLTVRNVVTMFAVVAVVTGGTLELRAGELGFLQSWFGKPASRPGQYASSWSQRLIYTYVGGRVFLAHPVLGTGWWGELPPGEFARFLPASRRRFADQPPAYFPPADRPYIPQQTYDQVLYELGAVGATLFLGVLALAAAAAAGAARRLTGAVAAIPALWLASSLGALAGAGLFGGAPLIATFSLTLGVVAALRSWPEGA